MSFNQLSRKEQDQAEEWGLLEFVREKAIPWEQVSLSRLSRFQAQIGLTGLCLQRPLICALFSVQFELEGWQPYFHGSSHIPLKEGYEKPSIEVPPVLQEILWDPKQFFFPKNSQSIYCGTRESFWQNNSWVHREVDLEDTQWCVGDFVTAYYVPS